MKAPAPIATESRPPSRLARLGAAAFYGGTSLLIIWANKTLLTRVDFSSPSALAASQMLVTTAVLAVLSGAGVVSIQAPSAAAVLSVFPLSALFLLDVLCSLSATKLLSLPMFAVLRRFSVPFTMILERAAGQAQPSTAVTLCVWTMVAGAFIAAYDDLAFSLPGYVVIFVGDALTAARGVYLKHATQRADHTRASLLFYQSLISLALMLPALIAGGQASAALAELQSFSATDRVLFGLASSLGLVLNYAIVVCTQVNSALTTTIVGCIKNLATTYAGMFIGGDYRFSVTNFSGITVSAVASVAYSALVFAIRSGGTPRLRSATKWQQGRQ